MPWFNREEEARRTGNKDCEESRRLLQLFARATQLQGHQAMDPKLMNRTTWIPQLRVGQHHQGTSCQPRRRALITAPYIRS